jgi:hypothetical protein
VARRGFGDVVNHGDAALFQALDGEVGRLVSDDDTAELAAAA